jgi:hypothetical protein
MPENRRKTGENQRLVSFRVHRLHGRGNTSVYIYGSLMIRWRGSLGCTGVAPARAHSAITICDVLDIVNKTAGNPGTGRVKG